MAQALTKSPVTSWEDLGGDARGVDVAGGAFSSDSSSKLLGLPVKKFGLMGSHHNILIFSYLLFSPAF